MKKFIYTLTVLLAFKLYAANELTTNYPNPIQLAPMHSPNVGIYTSLAISESWSRGSLFSAYYRPGAPDFKVTADDPYLLMTQFVFEAVGDNYTMIRSVDSGLCMTARPIYSALFTQQICSTTNEFQRFKALKIAQDVYQFQLADSNYCLELWRSDLYLLTAKKCKAEGSERQQFKIIKEFN
jgi:hypothetical protein